MSGPSTYEPKTGFTKWLDARLPVIRFAQDTMIDFPTPKNLNYWWTFGGILAVCLAIQIVSGIVLAMHYVASTDKAFASVEHIMRDVDFGWLIRYIHSNGASMFFLAVYVHMFRGLYYGSYKAPREILWILGVVIYLLMMATAFMGYVLPWGQMSFHGSAVITNLIGALPLIGDPIKTYLQGGPAIGDPTLNRFFSLHYLLPFVIAGVVVLHIWALHVVGNGNPTGVSVKEVRKDTVPFHPYYTVKDGFAIVLFLILFATFVFYFPNILGHADNYIEANPLATPTHIVPEWYLLPFYAILRAITFDIGPLDAKLLGVLAMFGAIGILFVAPWLDTSKVRSMRYRPFAQQAFLAFVVACIGLGFCGANLPDDLVFKTGPDQVALTYPGAGGKPVREMYSDGAAAIAKRDQLNAVAAREYFAKNPIPAPTVAPAPAPTATPAPAPSAAAPSPAASGSPVIASPTPATAASATPSPTASASASPTPAVSPGASASPTPAATPAPAPAAPKAPTVASTEKVESGFKWLYLSWIFAAYYFAYWLVILPLLGIVEKPKARPASIADSVHKKSRSAAPASAPVAQAAE